MSKEFYSILGDELCTIKNSPFYKLGQKPNPIDGGQLLRSNLSYDPDRLFNEKRFKQKQQALEDQGLIQIKEQERIEEKRIQLEMLRQATKQEFQRKLKELQLQNDQRSAPKNHSIFKTGRSFCQFCRKCSLYRGNFARHPAPSASDPTKTVEFLGCLNCRCPMNAHHAISFPPSNRPTLWKHLRSQRIKQQHLNGSYFLCAYRLRGIDPLELMGETAELMGKFGLQAISWRADQSWSFKMGLLRVGLLGTGGQPAVQQANLRLAESIREAGRWVEVAGEQFEDNMLMIKKIQQESHSKLLCVLEEDDYVLLFLLRTPSIASQQSSLLKAMEEYLSPLELLYCSSSKKQSMLACQQFFPSQFQLSSRLFILPKQETSARYRFKDILDYNGYNIYFDGISNIKRNNVENALKFLTFAQQTYLLGNDIASQTLGRLGMIFAAKTGVHHLNHYGELPSYLQVPRDRIESVVSELFTQYCSGQRCVVVLRPVLAGSGLEEIVVNLLRLNGFILLQRLRGALSEGSARYLSALQHIPQEDLQAYLTMMTTGVCEVLLISKRSALYHAHALLNQPHGALSEGNSRWVRDRPAAEVRRGKQIFKQQLHLTQNHRKQDIFSGAGALLNMKSLLFGSNFEQPSRVLQNNKTGELLKVTEGGGENQLLKTTVRQREAILADIKKDSFNYLLFNSKSQKSTEELVGLFFPDCSLFQSAIIIVKPTFLHLLAQIKNTLANLRYHIIFSKTVQLSKQFAEQLISDLQKLKMDRESVRESVELYSGQKVAFICVSKLSARKELLSLLSNFSFLPSRTIIQSTHSEQELKETLIPVWNLEQKYLTVFNRHLSSLEDAALQLSDDSRLSKQQKQQLTEYFIGSILGVRPDNEGKTSIGKINLYVTNERTAKFQSWYYSTISSIYPQSVPLLFQYRLFGISTLVAQTHPGEPFMAVIVNHYIEEGKHKNNQSQIKGKSRKSMALFIWAKKLLRFIQQLSNLTSDTVVIPIEIQGWGSIIYHNNEYKGQLTQSQSIDKDRRTIQKAIAKYPSNRQLVVNCKKMLQSRILTQRYSVQNRRLLPGFSQLPLQQCFRVSQQGQVSKLFLKGQFQMLDPDHQRSTGSKNLLSLGLYRTKPHIATRYWLLAQIILFLQKWQEQALQYREVFADILEHVTGFIGKYTDLEFLEFQIYLILLEQLLDGSVPEERLKVYPLLRKGRMRVGEEVVGKNRKFLQQKQYFKGSQQHSEEALEEMRLKYANFNLQTLEEPQTTHPLNNKEDYLHGLWNQQGNYVNLLREGQGHERRGGQGGVYVQYEKTLSENEAKVRGQLQGQIQKLGGASQETLLRDRGIDDQIWYKRIRSGPGSKPSNKLDSAISKQLEKLTQFKQLNS